MHMRYISPYFIQSVTFNALGIYVRIMGSSEIMDHDAWKL
jgi:hypothetical protein